MANAEILISNSAIIMTGMVMIMMASGYGATALRVGATRIGCCGDGHGGLVTEDTWARDY